MELICTSEVFKKYQTLTSLQGKLNLNFLKNLRVCEYEYILVRLLLYSNFKQAVLKNY